MEVTRTNFAVIEVKIQEYASIFASFSCYTRPVHSNTRTVGYRFWLFYDRHGKPAALLKFFPTSYLSVIGERTQAPICGASQSKTNRPI